MCVLYTSSKIFHWHNRQNETLSKLLIAIYPDDEYKNGKNVRIFTPTNDGAYSRID